MKIFGRQAIGHLFEATPEQVEDGEATVNTPITTLCGLNQRLTRTVDLTDRASDVQPWTTCTRCVRISSRIRADDYNELVEKHNELCDQFGIVVGKHNVLADKHNELLQLAAAAGVVNIVAPGPEDHS